MKKFTFVLILALALCLGVTALAADITVTLNGAPIDTRDVNGTPVPPFIQNGTTYVPVRAIAGALGLDIDWDGATRTVFIGDRGNAAPEQGDKVNIYVDGAKFTPRDAKGAEVAPIIKDGTTYLPVRAIAQAFGKKVDWDGANQTVVIKDASKIDTAKTYKIVAQGTNSAVTPEYGSSGSGLTVDTFAGEQGQIWKFEPVDNEEGFYFIVNLQSGCAMDVNGQSREPGATILQYNKGTGDNQKFMLVQREDGSYKIYSKNSMLPFENSAGILRQNSERDSAVQNWVIEEAEAQAQPPKTPAYKKIVVKGSDTALTYSVSGTALNASAYTGADTQQWLFEATAEGYYAINTKNGGKSIDVANNSTSEGDPLITYASSTDDNQRWILEKQADGGYKLKSLHSDLYAAVAAGGELVQTAAGTVFDITEAE